MLVRAVAATLIGLAIQACADAHPEGVSVVTFPGSAVGAEAELLRSQIADFEAANPDVRVVVQSTPDDATQRHQLYVQRLNARSGDPDILQLDVIWTSEFAAAGWLLPLDRSGIDREAFFSATVDANTWEGTTYAIPWFVDVGMLYWRTDLIDAPPETTDELVALAERGMGERVPRGIVWQGARYEGLITTFLEVLGAFGGRIMTPDGRVVVDSDEAVEALTFLRDQIHRWEIAPEAVLTWHEEEARFAFQNGTSVMMRNWPYAYALMNGEDSRVAGRFAVAPMPAAPGGEPTVALGGSQLAINANTDTPEAARRLVAFLTDRERMLERAEALGQFPTRPALFDEPRLDAALPMSAARAREIIEAARPRPVTPIYTQLSEILQIELHRALVGQAEPREALRRAAREMEETIEETGIRDLHRRGEDVPATAEGGR